MLDFFGSYVPKRTFKARTKEELDFLLSDKVFNNAEVIQVYLSIGFSNIRLLRFLWTNLTIRGG